MSDKVMDDKITVLDGVAVLINASKITTRICLEIM